MTEPAEIVAAWRAFFEDRLKRRPRLVESYIHFVEKLAEQDLPPIFEMEHMSRMVGIELFVLGAQAGDPDQFYRHFLIPKRSGGCREISVPSPSLMMTQRWILDNILKKIACHPDCHGFAEGKSIISNASVHLGAKSVLRMDIKDFFPSISMRRGIATFLRAGYPPNVSYFLASLCFKENALPQGAPTSPQLSNIVGKRMDARISGLAKSASLKYTRYADDLILSGDRIDYGTIRAVERVVEAEGFRINPSKTRLMRAGHKMIVTGVSISSGRLKLPRNSVRQIKQDSHYLLKRGLIAHSEATGRWDPILTERLLGQIGFWLQLEPDNKVALSLQNRLKHFDPLAFAASQGE